MPTITRQQTAEYRRKTGLEYSKLCKAWPFLVAAQREFLDNGRTRKLEELRKQGEEILGKEVGFLPPYRIPYIYQTKCESLVPNFNGELVSVKSERPENTFSPNVNRLAKALNATGEQIEKLLVAYQKVKVYWKNGVYNCSAYSSLIDDANQICREITKEDIYSWGDCSQLNSGSVKRGVPFYE